MLIGGFQHVDMSRLTARSAIPADRATLPSLLLPADRAGRYSRQVLTNNGRTATIYLLRHCLPFGPDDVLLLPDYLCLSILTAVEEAGVRYRFYRIGRDLSIDMESLDAQLAMQGDGQAKGIYIIPYFGVPYDAAIVRQLRAIREHTGIPIIEDITQTLLTADEARVGFGDYLVGSTRKWFAMTDGGILAARDGAAFTDAPLEDAYNEAAYKQLLISLLREQYDAQPELSRQDYLAWEAEANRVRYTDLAVREMTEFARNVLFASDLAAIAERRRANYAHLHARLSRLPGVTILSKPMDGPEYVPFGLVVLVEERDRFYRYLADRDVIGEIQWILPLDHYDPGSDARYLSDHNLMLHCDQRYTEREMDLVADAVEAFFA